MRSEIARRILAKVPQEVREFNRLYGAIVIRVHDLLDAKGINQKTLAEKMGKKPSEISKWLSGEHNFTLRSIAKLQAELGEPIIVVPQKQKFQRLSSKKIVMKQAVPIPDSVNTKGFQSMSVSANTNEEKVA